MIYAVNKTTKEHRVVDASVTYVEWDKWTLVEADAEGWILWRGGECPLPDDARVKLRTRNGVEHRLPIHAGNQRWGRGGGQYDIIAYRPILDADTKPEAPEWEGVGFPPEGAKCDAYVLAETKDQGRPKDEWRTGISEGTAQAANGGLGCLFSDAEGRRHFVGAQTYFRPIRSEEDKAVDAMARIIADGHDVYIGAHEAAQRLYRAGYRTTADGEDV